MHRTGDKKLDSGKATSDRNDPVVATGDATSQETDPMSSDNDSSTPGISSEGVASPPATTPTATSPPAITLVQDDIHLALGGSGPITDLASGEETSNLKKNLDLKLKHAVSSVPRLPIITLGDETCPLMGSGQPFALDLPLNMPLVSVDGSRCLSQSGSTSEESLKCLQGTKVDNLDVNFSPGKRKTRTSPIRESSDGSSTSEPRPDSSEKPRQKKSVLMRILGREKSPLRKKEKAQMDSEKSPTDSRGKLDKSPTYVKKNKSPKRSPNKLEINPIPSPKKSPKSPSKMMGIMKGVFFKKTEESKQLCETDDSVEIEDPPKKTPNKNTAKTKSKDLTEGFYITGDLNSDTTCDSTSSKFSLMASISIDSNTSDAGNAARTNISDGTADNVIQETETSSSESNDDRMDEKETL